VAAKELAGRVGVGSVKRQGIQLVITHDGLGGAGFDHGPHRGERLADLRAAVDEVADEEGLAAGMGINAAAPGVAESFEQRVELVAVAVDVADEVVHGHHLSRRGADGQFRPFRSLRSPPLDGEG
jgi:hypothetical protein